MIQFNPAEQQSARQYLLGGLSEAEMAAVEERYFREDQYFEAIEALEDELIQDFVLGRLAPGEKTQFEKKYNHTKALRQRVQVARAVVEAVAAAAKPPVAARAVGPEVRETEAGRHKRWSDFLGLGWPVLAPASALLVLGLAGYLHLASQVAGLRDRPGGEAPAVSFLLSPGQLQSGAAGLPRLLVHRGTRVRLELELRDRGEARSYRARVATADDDQIWSGELPAAATTPSGRVIALELPPNLFKPGQYAVRVTALRPSGALEDVDSYPFVVKTP